MGFGAIGNGIADDNAALTAAAAYASTLAGATGRAWVDGAGNTFKVVSAAVVAPHNVGFRNMTLDFSTVAATTNDYNSFYCAIAGQGSIGSTVSTISSPTRVGAMGCTVNNNSLANGDLVLIGHTPPQTLVNGSINSTAHTLTVDSTTAFPASGMLLVGSEIVAYTAKASSTEFTIRTTPEGRGRMGTTAATIADNALVVLVHSGHWALSRTTAVSPAEANYVQAAPRALAGGGYSILFRHSFDRIFSNGQSAWIKRVTPLRRPALDNVTLIGSSSQGRSSGQEVGYYYRYADGLDVTGVKLINCSDAHGTLDTCFNFSVEQEVLGKADSSAYDGHYGLSLVNGCHWGRSETKLNRNAFKAVTAWASGISSVAASQAWFGFPRHIECAASQIYNCGTPWDNAHEMFEAHSWVENVRFSGASGADGLYGVTWEGGKNLALDGGLVTRTARAALGVAGAYATLGLKVGGMTVGDRTLLEAGTALDTTIVAGDTTIILDDADWITDLTSDTTPVMVKIDSEWIRLGTRTTGGTFTGCTRGYYGTTAAGHTAGAIVYALGNAFYTPIDLDFSRCSLYLNDPDSYASKLSGAIIAGATTIGVSELSAFPAASATEIKFAEIEGENSADGYASEIISYTGKSAASGAGNLTGVVRGRKHTDDVAHSADMLIQPYVCALADVAVTGVNCATDVPRSAVYVTGYIPTENCAFTEVSGRWAGALANTAFFGTVEPHGWRVSGGKLQNFPLGWRSYGNGQTFDGVAGELDTLAVSGEMFLVHGDRTVIDAAKAWRYYVVAEIVAGATKSAVRNCVGHETVSGTNGVNDSGTSSSLVNNTTIA